MYMYVAIKMSVYSAYFAIFISFVGFEPDGRKNFNSSWDIPSFVWPHFQTAGNHRMGIRGESVSHRQ